MNLSSKLCLGVSVATVGVGILLFAFRRKKSSLSGDKREDEENDNVTCYFPSKLESDLQTLKNLTTKAENIQTELSQLRSENSAKINVIELDERLTVMLLQADAVQALTPEIKEARKHCTESICKACNALQRFQSLSA
eukprot:PhF_6_TR18438/c0_g1_i1/m.27026